MQGEEGYWETSSQQPKYNMSQLAVAQVWKSWRHGASRCHWAQSISFYTCLWLRVFEFESCVLFRRFCVVTLVSCPSSFSFFLFLTPDDQWREVHHNEMKVGYEPPLAMAEPSTTFRHTKQVYQVWYWQFLELLRLQEVKKNLQEPSRH